VITTAAAARPRFSLGAHAALAASILALLASGTLGPLPAAILATVIALAIWRDHRGLAPTARAERLGNWAALAYLIAFTADLLVLSHDLLGASIRLLVFLVLLRLLTARSDRDRLQILLISLLAMVASTASTTEISFSVPLAVYVVAALGALAARQADLAAGAGGSLAVPRVPALAPLLGRSGATLALGLGIFFLIPHIGTGYFRAGGSIRQKVSGFSGRVELGSINRIKRNHEIVMRVRLSSPLPPGGTLRWRGMTFDAYDGRSWTRTRASIAWLRISSGGFRLAAPTGLPVLDYSISLEPLEAPALFAAAEPLQVDSSDFFHLGSADDGGLQLTSVRRDRIDYQVRSELTDMLRLKRRLEGLGRDYPASIAATYLSLPPLDPGIRGVAEELAAGATDPLAIAERIERGLRERYTYTLDVEDEGVADPLARFLLAHAPGHCEYFATAMAVLVRLEGVPSRVVTGFLRGTYSDLHGTLLVRQSDAHSWVEVYFPGRGWVAFDPTPPQPEEAEASLWARWIRGLEQIEIAWDTWVIGLDLRDQSSILSAVRDEAARGLAAAAGFARRAFALGPGTVVLLLVLVGSIAALAWRRPRLPRLLQSWWRRRGRRAPRDPILQLYSRFLAELARRGLARHPSQTPHELVRLAIEHAGVPREGTDLTDLYCRVRYGGARATPQELERAERLLTRLTSTAR
jgi:transglutaminase-like putative cysteine protease